jgi:hypothetical protein
MARLEVRVQPRASHEQIGAVRQGVLTVRVSSPPLDGRANKAVCRLVAGHLGVASSRVRLVRGARARTKLLEIDGLTQSELEARLGQSD